MDAQLEAVMLESLHIAQKTWELSDMGRVLPNQPSDMAKIGVALIAAELFREAMKEKRRRIEADRPGG